MRSERKSDKKNIKVIKGYFKYVFTSVIINNEPMKLIMGVSCFEKLTNKGMKPSELARHLTSRHPEHENKPLQIFQ